VAPPPSGWDAGAAPWTTAYPAGVPTTYDYPAVPAGRLLDDAAQDFPHVPAIEYRGYRLTYRKLLDHVDRLATALSAVGVGPGDRIAVVLPNCPQLVICVFAIWRIGAVATMPSRQDAVALAAAEPRVVVILDRWYATAVVPVRDALPSGTAVVVTARADYLPFPRNVLASLRGRFPRVARSHGVLGFADLIRRSHPAPEEPADRLDAIAAISRSACASQRALVINSFQLRLWLPDIVAGDERVLLAVPLSSLTGVVWMLTTVLSAATMIVVDESRAAQRQWAASRARPTIAPLDAAVARDLLRHSWRRGTLSSVRIAVSTDPLDRTVSAQLEQLTDKGRIRRAWGVGGVVTHADPIYGRVRHDAVGLPLPDTEAVVVDPATGQAVPLGSRGHLWLRGPQLGKAAWVDAEVDASLDADGYLVVHATADDDDPPGGAGEHHAG
jgi:long-chain acyl-CoA synthetase